MSKSVIDRDHSTGLTPRSRVFLVSGLLLLLGCALIGQPTVAQGGWWSALTGRKNSIKKSEKKFDVEAGLKSAKKLDRLESAERAKKKGDRVPVKILKDARMAEKDPLVRHRLNQAIFKTDPKEALDLLIDSLVNDPSHTVRQGAAQSLSGYPNNPKAVAALAKALEKDSVPRVRYACANSLALSEILPSLTALEKAAKDPDPRLRRQVAYSLKRHTGKKAQQILKALERDSDPSVQAEARKED